MQLASFSVAGQDSFGIVTEAGIIDAGRRLPPSLNSLRAVLAAHRIDDLRELLDSPPDYRIDQIEFQPVIPAPAKILCIGANYLAHIRETGKQPPPYPWVFVRFANSLVGHEQPLIRPHVSPEMDYEGELAIVIGRTARHVARADALDFVAGYSCFNDGTLRDFQRHTPQFTAGKNFYRSGACGPVLVTADAIPDPSTLVLETRVNGTVMQHANTSDLCFDVPALIAYCSTFAQLEAGDIIATGTPGGVGAWREPPVYLKAGDTVEVEISGIGVLRNPVIDDEGIET